MSDDLDIKLHLLETITNKFSEDHRVGRGGYGAVYRGVYKGKEIAVKKLHQLQGLDDKAFDNEFRNLSKVHHKNVRSSDFNFLAIDPALELRFLFEPRKAISCCLQLTNITDGYIAFNIKINRTKYRAQPSKGMMRPCSKRYITVTLLAQEEALVQCNDMFIVLGANVNKDLKSDEITEDLFKEAMKGKVVDVASYRIQSPR
ncbi:unnamed protein product [Miscanthus lutarioriparius]|uniref:MSP domain-containing protein n=1 Tax=Miscanthus lutarioriparius TaxID=422564 RepID=A0A811RKV8_9POAL|nr:unnamed protein product [Miscanthus lutarioriparius]